MKDLGLQPVVMRGGEAFYSKAHCHQIPLRMALEFPLYSDACFLLFSHKGQCNAGQPACILSISPLPSGI